jgi:hypothetical protein
MKDKYMGLLLIGNLLAGIGVVLYFILPFLIIELDKTNWQFVTDLLVSLVFWSFYFAFVKGSFKFLTTTEEGRKTTDVYPLSYLLLHVWLFCFIFSGILYSFLEGIASDVHRIDYAIVSFFISGPYLTVRFIKYYVWDKKKKKHK